MIASYLRVSGKGQILGDGFARQREACERYATENELTIDRYFEERGVSGCSDWDDRESWVEMVASEPTIIIVEALDRLARQFAVQEIFLRQLRKLNIKLISTREPDYSEDDDDPTRRLIRGVLGLLAEFDRSQIEAKLRSARQRIRTREGRCEGRKPFGCDPGRGIEVETLTFMQAMREHGATHALISAALNDSVHKTRTGKPWHPSTVAKILKRQK